MSVMGIDVGPTGTIEREDFICQGCGAGFSLDNPAKRRFFGCIGLIVFGMFGPSAFLIGLGSLVIQRDPAAPIVIAVGVVLSTVAYGVWRWMDAPARAYRMNPIVPGAPAPVIRFSAPETPARKCSCGGRARSFLVTEHESRGISQGTTTKFRCEACKREFSIDSVRGILLLGFAVAVFLAIGIALLMHSSGQGWGAWTCSGLVTAFAVLGGVAFVFQVVERVRHPLAETVR